MNWNQQNHKEVKEWQDNVFFFWVVKYFVVRLDILPLGIVVSVVFLQLAPLQVEIDIGVEVDIVVGVVVADIVIVVVLVGTVELPV